MIKDIKNRLTALQFMLKQAHWQFTEIGIHTIIDRLVDPIDEFTDRMVEIYIGETDDIGIGQAQDALLSAGGIVPNKINFETSDVAIATIGKFYKDLAGVIEDECKPEAGHKQGLNNVLADISEYCYQSMYLLRGITRSSAVTSALYKAKEPVDFSKKESQATANMSDLKKNIARVVPRRFEKNSEKKQFSSIQRREEII